MEALRKEFGIPPIPRLPKVRKVRKVKQQKKAQKKKVKGPAQKPRIRKPNLKTLDLVEIRRKVEHSGINNSRIRMAKAKYKILERDKWCCVECKSEKQLTIDHLEQNEYHSKRSYKAYELSICQTLCKMCHMKKNGWLKDEIA